MITETLNLVTTKDGEQIAVWKVVNSIKNRPAFDDNVFDDSDFDVPAFENPNFDNRETGRSAIKAQNVLLTHGTFSDKKACLRIAGYLAKLGHHCYIMEWRDHGHSSAPKDKFNFETVATYDLDATFRYLFDELELDNLHCVTHSGGGVCLTMFLIQQLLPQNRSSQSTDYIDKLSSISMFACQAYGAVLDPKSYARILATKSFNRLFGYIPAKKLKLGTVNESYHTMVQWYDWNLNKDFKSSFIKQPVAEQKAIHQKAAQDENLDYRQHMPKITTPIYAISAKGDNFISPTRGCKLFFDDFSNPSNVFQEYSTANGHLSDYTHSRIMMSRDAAKEIWPTVAAWINKHAK